MNVQWHLICYYNLSVYQTHLRQFTALMNLQSLWLLDKGQGKVIAFLAKVQESTIFTLVLKPHPAD